MYEIDKTVPVPESATGRRAKYPFSKMEIGDSFVAEVEDTSVTSSAYYYGKRHGVKFTSESRRNHGTRIWRIE